MKFIYGILVLLVISTFFSCNPPSNKNGQETNTAKIKENNSQKEKNDIKILNVLSTTNLFSEPTTKSAKIINQKLSNITGETEYVSIDKSCKVVIINEKDNWYKIKVVDPYWLSESHIGWCKSEYIENINNIEEIEIEKDKDYTILYRNKIGQCENIYIYYKNSKKDELTLEKISKKLHSELSTIPKCNLHIFDSDKLGDLIHKYPLTNKEYLQVADHFLYLYDFDKYGWFYPFQDIKYKELGGKNWKKEPIK